MLTPEERKRIEDEERKRIAEEQYRTEVRSKLREESGTLPRQPSRLPWALGVGVVLILGVIIIRFNTSKQPKEADASAPVAQAASAPAPAPPPPPAPVEKTRYVPANQKIATGQILVKANGYVQYRLMITPDMVEPTVTGSFNASGGSGNDITAVIADEANYTNWINGHQARVFWGTEGKQTTGNLEVRLAPGMYYLVFSNKFSAFTDKQVFLEIDLNYKKAETYYE